MTDITTRTASAVEQNFAKTKLIKLMAQDLIASAVSLDDPLKCACVLIEKRFQAKTVDPHLDAAIELARKLEPS